MKSEIGTSGYPKPLTTVRENIFFWQDTINGIKANRPNVASMEGYAICRDDFKHTPVRVPVSARSDTKSGIMGTFRRGTVAEIWPDAPIPPGADTVVSLLDAHIIQQACFSFGEGALPSSYRPLVGEALLLSLPSEGSNIIPHRRAPLRVAIIYPCAADGSVTSYGVVEQLVERIAEEQGATTQSISLPDGDESSIAEALRETANGSDLIVVSQGAVLGEIDLLTTALRQVGRVYSTHSFPLYAKAKPFILGSVASTLAQIPVIGLPGNPTLRVVLGHTESVFDQYVEPIIRHMCGIIDQLPAS